MMGGRRQIGFVGGFVCVALLAAMDAAVAQNGEPAAITLSELQMRLKHAQSETELEPKVAQKVIETYQSAIERFEIADEATKAAKTFLQQMNSVSEELQIAKGKLAVLPESPTVTISSEDDVDSLERQLEERRKLIEDPEHGFRAQAEALKRLSSTRKNRLEEISHELAEIDERLEMIQQEMETPAPEDQPRELTMALQTLLQVRRMRATEERTTLHTEQSWCESDQINDLLRTQRDIAVKVLALADAEAQFIQDAIDQRRGSEADQRVRAAELVVTQANQSVKQVAEANLQLAKESRDVTTALHETNERLEITTDTYNTLKAEFDQSQTMVKAVGQTESIGLLLRQQRAKISDTRGLHSRLTLRGDKVRQTRMRTFQIEVDIAALMDLDAASTKIATELLTEEGSGTASAITLNPKVVERLATEIRPLLEQRNEILERLLSDYGTEFEKMVLLDNDERKLLDLTEKYAAYIDERVLWIRTGSIFGSAQTSRAMANFAWLLDRANWIKVIEALQINFQREPLPYAFALAGFLLWIATRWGLRRRLQSVGIGAAEHSCREMFPTLQAILLTVLLASFVPAALGFFSWRLDHSSSTAKFVHAVALGLRRAAVFAASMELLRLIVIRGGLAEKHFDWSENALIRLRRHLYWFVPAGIALVAIVGMIEATSDEQRLDSLGRVDYLLFAGLLAFFCHRAFPRFEKSVAVTPAGPPPPQDPRRSSDFSAEDEVWVNRFARFGSFLSVAIPLGLLVLCWSGYFYTALQLTWRLQSSTWLVLGLVLLRGTVRRWITLERRRMAVLQAEELQAIVGASKDPGTDAHSPFLFPRWTWPDFRLNLTQIVTQVRSLLDTGLLTLAAIGLWFIWADVTPALNILDRFTLWQTTVEEVVPVTTAAKDGDEKAAVQTVQVVKRAVPITVANLGLALLILSIAVVAGRNVPGLVEVILLEHLSVDAGIRFATTCLVRYAIFTTGVALAFNEIGIGWNSVQWLVAAASVGLGFGLQEIFANFVSGIILLFERPMRVGDVITIGDTTGTVSRIRFRATTIVDGDRKELIVPNKSFITGNLLNWTLSDSVNRVAIKVGVAYGSNPNQVRELLLKIASEHPSLLKDPAPTASLEELGDSALVFQMQAFLPTLKDRQRATHELNTMIHDRFKAAGIDIPFPQQEVTLNMRDAAPRNEPHTDLHGSLEAALKRAGVNV